MIASTCPYCNENNKRDFRIRKQYGNNRNVICDKCGGEYKVSLGVRAEEYANKKALKKVIPMETVKIITDVIKRHLGWHGKGGYENGSDIKLATEYSERIDTYDNCYEIAFEGMETKYSQREFRRIEFCIYPNGGIRQKVNTGRFDFKREHWFKGDTLAEKVENYIQECLVKWETI